MLGYLSGISGRTWRLLFLGVLAAFLVSQLALAASEEVQNTLIRNTPMPQLLAASWLSADNLELEGSGPANGLVKISINDDKITDIVDVNEEARWKWVLDRTLLGDADVFNLSLAALNNAEVVIIQGEPIPVALLETDSADTRQLRVSEDARLDPTPTQVEPVATEQPTILPTATPTLAQTQTPTEVGEGETNEPETVSCDSAWFFAPAPKTCPAEASISRGAQQWFENGTMLWSQTRDSIYILSNSGELNIAISDTFDAAVDPVLDEQLETPEGLWQPTYGFGKAWRDTSSVRETIGWGTVDVVEFSIVVQCALDESVCFTSTSDGAVLQMSNNQPWQLLTEVTLLDQ